MVTTYLPISAHVRLTQLQHLKNLLTDKKGLTPQQEVLANQVFHHKSLSVLRRQALTELVAGGYLDEEIKLVLADPESPYSILIENLKPTNLSATLRDILQEIRLERRNCSTEMARDEYVRTNRRVIDATWATLAEASTPNHKVLLDIITDRSRSIAEAEGIVFTRAGRSRTKQSEDKQPDNTEKSPAGNDESDPRWEEEYKTDESTDSK